MTSPKKNQEPLGTYAEAMRYVENAKECLKKAGKSGSYYSDPKYVKMAGNTLWNGVLVALAAKFPVKGRPDIDKYRQEVGKLNKSKLKALNAGYSTCHLSMGYDGNISVAVVNVGLKTAEELIEWAAPD
jgi:phosphopantetheinyl transferase (holo-ACP synthase)